MLKYAGDLVTGPSAVAGTTPSHRWAMQRSTSIDTGSRASCSLTGNIKAYCVMITCRAMLLNLEFSVLDVKSITLITVITAQYQRAALAADWRTGHKTAIIAIIKEQVGSAVTSSEGMYSHEAAEPLFSSNNMIFTNSILLTPSGMASLLGTISVSAVWLNTASTASTVAQWLWRANHCSKWPRQPHICRVGAALFVSSSSRMCRAVARDGSFFSLRSGTDQSYVPLSRRPDIRTGRRCRPFELLLNGFQSSCVPENTG